MAFADITREAVLSALAEADAKGVDQFLSDYGFVQAKRYWLIGDGGRYPSKAIAGAAHGYLEGQAPLRPEDFSGGEATVGKKLTSLGFQVEALPANPDWVRDELILALDLYHSNSATIPGKESKAVLDLSALLNAMHKAIGTEAGNTIRNANGVYLKLMNIRSLDPAYRAQGKVGMKSGGKLEKTLWAEYFGRKVELASDAASIREAISALAQPTVAPPGSEPDPYEGEEGGVVLRLHKRYERDPKLVREKLRLAKAAQVLVCEVCSFDFTKTYGSLSPGYVEVHHTKPVHMMKPGSKTKLSDLALLCANCHRVAHSRRVPLTLDQIRDSMPSSG